jgi:hypothetical protein
MCLERDSNSWLKGFQPNALPLSYLDNFEAGSGRVGFEPTVKNFTTIFKIGTLNHSATYPLKFRITGFEPALFCAQDKRINLYTIS